MKAERLPAREYRRLTGEQKQAVDRLRWSSPNPANRARLKLLLGWKRTRGEAAALVRELQAEGLNRKAIAGHLDVSDRHLRRLLAEPANTGLASPENGSANPVPMPGLADTTRGPCGINHPDARRPPPTGFESFAELDHWLEARR